MRERQGIGAIKGVGEKTEKLFTYGWLVIFVGIMLSVFQQAVGINAVLYFAPRIFESMGMGDPMVQTVFMGIVNLFSGSKDHCTCHVRPSVWVWHLPVWRSSKC